MNWGWKLIVASALFMIMIIYFVVQSVRHKTAMVSDHYYEEELHYQDKLDASARANRLVNKVEITRNGGQLIIQYPQAMLHATGDIVLYNTAKEGFDKTFACITSDSVQRIDNSGLIKGRYLAKTTLVKDGQQYYFEQRITIE